MSDGKDDFWESLGCAVVILSICLGIGGCNYLIAKSDVMRQQTESKQ